MIGKSTKADNLKLVILDEVFSELMFREALFQPLIYQLVLFYRMLENIYSSTSTIVINYITEFFAI